MRDNEDGIQGRRQIHRRTSTVAEMRDNRDVYGGGEDTGQQQKRCGTTEMAKWVGRMAADWENTDRE